MVWFSKKRIKNWIDRIEYRLLVNRLLLVVLSDVGGLKIWLEWIKIGMIDKIIEVVGVRKLFMEFYIKGSRIIAESW